jgi:hypothetical protein
MIISFAAVLEDMKHAWLGLPSAFAYDFNLDSFNEAPPTVSLSTKEFVPWFEAELVSLCSSDLGKMHSEMRTLNGKIKDLKLVSTAFR